LNLSNAANLSDYPDTGGTRRALSGVSGQWRGYYPAAAGLFLGMREMLVRDLDGNTFRMGTMVAVDTEGGAGETSPNCA
jgi:hypothetical protein